MPRTPFVVAAILVFAPALPASRALLAQYSVTVTPDGSSVTPPANTSGLTVQFTVKNTGSAADYYGIWCSYSAPVTGCSESITEVSLNPNQSTVVTVTYSTGSAASGTLTLEAMSYDNMVSDQGYYNVTVTAPPAVSVTPDGSTTGDHEANTNGYNQSFTVTNTGGSSGTFNLSCGDSQSPVSCTGLSTSSVNLAPSAYTGVTAYYNVGGAGTGTLKLDASGDATDFGYYNVPVHTYSVAVTPDGGTTPDREANTNGYTATFTVQNTGTSTVSYSISCGGANGVTCTGTSTSSVNNLGASASTTVDAYYNVGAAGTGTLTLTATSTSGPSRNDGGSFNVPIHSYSVAVTPDGGTTPDRVTNSTGHSASFTVQNTGTSTVTYSISCGGTSGVTCTGVSQSSVQLGASASTGVSAYYDVGAIGTGSLTLTASSTTGPSRSDGGSFNVPIVPYPITNWDTKPFNHDHQARGRCAAGCFTVTAAHSTVPYFSLDAPRNVTLVYSGDRVHPKPFVHLDVQKPTSQTPTYVLLQVKKQGVLQTFVNGETTLKFTAASSGYQRIGGQLRDSTWTTGMYDVEIVVTWDYGSSSTWQSWATRIMVVNETDALIARGWTIAGVQRVYPQSGSHVLITEGDGSGVFFAYAGGNFTSPTGDFSKLEIYGSGWRRRYADSTKVVFNSAGLMTDVYDSFGARTQFFYDGSNRLTTVRDPNSKDLVVAYGTYGLSSIRDNVGTWRYTNVTVNSSKRLVTIQDPGGGTTQFGYDGSHRMTSVTDRKGNPTTFAWQRVNDTLAVTGKLRSITADTIQVYENGSLSNVPPKTTFAPWDTVGVPYTATASSPAAMVRPDTIRGRVTEPSGKITKFTVDRWGQPVTTINALSQTTTITYDANGLAIKASYPTGGADSTAYNTDGLPTYLKPSGVTATEVFYNSTWKAQPDSVKGTNRPYQRFWVGSGGRVDSSVAASGKNKVRYTYDSYGRVTQVTDHNGDVVATRQYQGTNGNLSAVLTPQRSHRYTHDSYGRVIADSIVGIGKRGFTYDVLNRQRKVADGLNTDSTEFVYDSLYLTKVIDPKGQEYEFDYNALGWAVWNEDPAGGRDSVWYSRDGEVTRTKNRRSQFIRFAYDDVHRLVKQWRTAAPADTAFFAYSTKPDTNWVKASNPYDTVTTYVSNHGLVDSTKTVVGGRTYTIRAQYSTAGWLDSVTATGSAGSFMGRRYLYNSSLGTLTDIRLSGQAVSITYDNKLRPEGWGSGGTQVDQEFVTTNFVASTVNDQTQLASLNRWLEHGFGRIRAQWEPGGAADLGNIFGYDKLDRLKADTSAYISLDECTWDEAAGWQCSPSTDQVATYYYDPVGNVDSVRSTDWGLKSGSYDSGNRLTAFAGCDYDTDADGNVTERACSGETVRFHWTAENLLKAIKVVGGDSLDFRYDATGRLVRRDTNTAVQAYFLWSGDHLFAELAANGVDRVEYSYYPGMDRLHAVSSASDTVYFAHQDGLGNTIGLVNHQNNQLRGSYGYDRWGAYESGSDDLGTGADNRSRFKGALWMGDLGPELYYMRNRWYEPKTGRFLSEDPIGLAGGINQYAFAGNDPVGGRDPLGLADCDVWIWKTLDAKGNVVDWGILDVVCWDDDDDDDGPGGGGAGARPQQKRRDLTCPLYAKFGIHCAPRPKPAEIKQCFAQNTAWMASDNALVAGAVGIGGSLASITGGAVASRWGHQWVYDATVEMDLFFGTRSSNARMFEGAIAARNAGKGLIRTGGRFLRGGLVSLAVQATFAASYLGTSYGICAVNPEY